MQTIPKPNNIIIDNQPLHVRCGFCPVMIYKHTESNGTLKLKEGFPVCVKCRILRIGKNADIIKNDKDKYKPDLQAQEEFIQKRADEQVEEIAMLSQDITDTKMEKKQ